MLLAELNTLAFVANPRGILGGATERAVVGAALLLSSCEFLLLLLMILSFLLICCDCAEFGRSRRGLSPLRAEG